LFEVWEVTGAAFTTVVVFPPSLELMQRDFLGMEILDISYQQAFGRHCNEYFFPRLLVSIVVIKVLKIQGCGEERIAMGAENLDHQE
jgi:hypothetical protein